jgi:dihydropteroate synthase
MRVTYNQVGKMISDATFIDIGAYSSKPSAEFVSENEELGRIVPVVQLILKHFPEALLHRYL